jgi:hypothetical protein
MRGIYNILAMLALSAGLAIVPSVGSQGAGTLAGRHMQVDAQVIRDVSGADGAVRAADRAAQAGVLALVSR